MKTPAQYSALTLAITLMLASCATTDGGPDKTTTGALIGASIGCAGGALLAKITGGDATTACVAGAAVGGLIGFEKAREEEIAEAERARTEAIQAMATLPPSKRASAGTVKTVLVTATDKKTNETKKYQAFDSVSVDLPLSAKGTPEYDQAMSKLKTLAERVADERGSAQIQMAMTPADVKQYRLSLTGGTVKTQKGSPITVSKFSAGDVPAGVERVTVKAGQLKQTEV
ncbi:MAG: hypothetical protein KGN37_16155 [Burkholderiales bacterium]|nr:hypothetical protein [Burkholderiales bacterium]